MSQLSRAAALFAVVAAMVFGVMASPAQAAVTSRDLPSTGTVAKYFPGYKYSSRTASKTTVVSSPGAYCRSSRNHTVKSGVEGTYLPTYMSDWLDHPHKPLVSVVVAEMATTARARSLVGAFRSFAKRCGSYTEDGMKIRVTGLNLGSIGEERVGMRMAMADPEGDFYATYSVVRKGRVVTLVMTGATRLVSGTRVAGLTRAAL